MPKGHTIYVSSGRKLFQMAKNRTHISRSKALRNKPELGFFGLQTYTEIYQNLDFLVYKYVSHLATLFQISFSTSETIFELRSHPSEYKLISLPT
jgi:hypothetical protein